MFCINFIYQGEDPENISPNPGWQHFRYSGWDNAVHAPDQLRQRMAYALSQILVISDDADIGGHARVSLRIMICCQSMPLKIIGICCLK